MPPPIPYPKTTQLRPSQRCTWPTSVPRSDFDWKIVQAGVHNQLCQRWSGMGMGKRPCDLVVAILERDVLLEIVVKQLVSAAVIAIDIEQKFRFSIIVIVASIDQPKSRVKVLDGFLRIANEPGVIDVKTGLKIVAINCSAQVPLT